MTRPTLSTEDQYRLALEAHCHARTVKRWLEGGKVQRATAFLLRNAAKKLKLDVSLPEGDAEQVAG